MVERGWSTQRLTTVVVGTMLTLSMGACTAGSPSATASQPVSESSGSATSSSLADASSTPRQTTPPGAWSAAGSLIEARLAHTATLLHDGTVLAAGGGAGPRILATAELYHPETGAWEPTGRMMEARAGHTATLLPDGRVLVAGGYGTVGGSVHLLTSAELYDPDTRAWIAAGRMLEARLGHTATLLPDGTVLVAGGYELTGGGASPLASAELYDPDAGSWSAAEGMIEARYDHTASRLLDGAVLVAGGVTSGGLSVASAELYDPRKGTWSATTTMPEVRSRHTATVLLDGSVLVAGGGSGAFAELYDADSGSWSATGSLVEALQGPFQGHTASLLHDGRVLVAGGSDADGLDSIADAALFDPTGGS